MHSIDWIYFSFVTAWAELLLQYLPQKIGVEKYTIVYLFSVKNFIKLVKIAYLKNISVEKSVALPDANYFTV